jgi:uncharacterized protein YceH (UPF0502 family)
MGPDDIEIRVVACLVEKQRTTPDVYPLTLNSLRLACNQSTNRDPVVDYDESTILQALERLMERKWATLASWSNRRVMKYRHTFDGAVGLSEAELAMMCVLMLRGPQTPGELKQRTERLHSFADLDDVDATLRGLIERGLVTQLSRRPGQREDRFMQLLGGGDDEPVGEHVARMKAASTPSASGQDPAPAEPVSELEERVARLEGEVLRLRGDIQALRSDLGD